MNNKKICICINDTTGAYVFRASLIERLVSEGYSVVIIGSVNGYKEEFENLGVKLIDISTSRHGTNPFEDLKLLRTYIKTLNKEKPNTVLTYNIKPNVYAGLACKKLGIPFISNVTGLGTPLEQKSKIQKLSIFLYKIGVKDSSCVFFQNEDNKRFFEKHKMLCAKAKTRIIPGSGVDLEKHPLLPYPDKKEIHFLFVARIRKEKGIDLFLAAAHEYASSTVVFDVCGQCEDSNYLKLLQDDESVNYYGQQKDLTAFYERCSCFLYPSYYPEGMSNVLLEAAASGRPVVATNRPGCKETVEDGVTGFLVPANDEKAVIEATQRFLNMSEEDRIAMGLKGHEKMVREFDRNIVVEAYIDEIEKAVK